MKKHYLKMCTWIVMTAMLVCDTNVVFATQNNSEGIYGNDTVISENAKSESGNEIPQIPYSSASDNLGDERSTVSKNDEEDGINQDFLDEESEEPAGEDLYWYKDYDYSQDDIKRVIVLNSYKGNSDTIIIPEKARISVNNNLVDYSVEIGNNNLFRNDAVSIKIGKNVKLPSDCLDMFERFYKLKNVDLSGADTSEVTQMCGMFDCCTNLESVSFSGIDTSNVTNMSFMFDCCDSLTELDLSSFDTQNVSNMMCMFESCDNLKKINLSSFDTSNVTNMECMFGDCPELKKLDLNYFSTGKVTDMQSMFGGCKGLTTLDLSSFDTGNVTTMMGMFRNCENLTDLNLSSFDTRNVTDMHTMFYSCKALETLDLSSFDTTSVTVMQDMFGWCESLESLDLSSFNTINVTNMRSMFSRCYKLSNLNLGKFDIRNENTGEDDWLLFYDCSALTSMDLREMVTAGESYQRIIGMFRNSGLMSLRLPKTLNILKCGSNLPESLIVLEIPKAVHSIDVDYTWRLEQLTDIYYLGSESDWKNIEGHEYLENAFTVIHYNMEMPRLINLMIQNVYYYEDGDVEHKKDILTEVQDLCEGDEGPFTIECMVKENLKSKIRSYSLYQGDNVISTNTTGKFQLNKTNIRHIRNAAFYIVASFDTGENTDPAGNVVDEIEEIDDETVEEPAFGNLSAGQNSVPINLQTLPGLSSNEAPEQIEFTDMNLGDLDKNVPYLGSANINLTFPNIPVKTEIVPPQNNGSAKIKVTIGKGDIEYSESFKKEVDSVFNKLKSSSRVGNIANHNYANFQNKWLDGNPFDFDVYGYAEGDWNGNGIQTIEGKIVLDLSGEVSHDFPVPVTAGAVFVTVKIEAGVAVPIGVKAKFQDDNGQPGNAEYELDYEIDFSIGLDGSINAGLIKLASIGVYGKGGLDIGIKPTQEKINVNSASLTGSLGVRAEIIGEEFDYAFAEATYDILNKKWDRNAVWLKTDPDKRREYNRTPGENFVPYSPTNMISALFDENSYVQGSRNYIPKVKSQNLETNAEGLNGEVNHITPLISDTYGGAAPVLISAENGKKAVMAFLYDDGSRSNSNMNAVMYSVYDSETKRWNGLHKLDNDDTLDSFAKLFKINGDVYIAFQNAREVVPENAELNEKAALLDICIAKYMNGIFSEPVVVSGSEDCYNRNPVIGMIDGKVTAVWVANQDPAYYGQNSTNEIRFSSLTGSEWSEPVTLISGLNCVTEIQISDGELFYCCDRDNDRSTIEDIDLLKLDFNGSKTTISSGSISGLSNVKNYITDNDERLVWSSGNNYVWRKPDGSSGKVLENDYAAGLLYHIDHDTMIFASGDGGKNNLFEARAYEGMFSSPVRITNQDKYIRDLGVDRVGDDLLAVFVDEDAIISDEGLDVKSNLSSVTVQSVNDLILSDVNYDFSTVKPDQNVNFKLYIYNNGNESVDSVKVNITDNNGTEILNKVINQRIASGRRKEIEVSAVIPHELNNCLWIMSVSQNNKTDIALEDNSKQIRFDYSELCISDPVLKIIEGRRSVDVTVSNNGPVSASNVRFAVLDYNTEETYYLSVLGNIESGESKDFVVDIDPSWADNTGNVKLIYKVLTDTEDYYDYNNSVSRGYDIAYNVILLTGVDDMVRSFVVCHNGCISSLPIPTHDGDEFLGWYSRLNGNGEKLTEETQILSDGVYYASWTNTKIDDTYENQFNGKPSDKEDLPEQNKKNVIVDYNSNGGTGCMKSARVKPGSKYKADYCSYLRPGYYFVEWNTLSNGRGISVKPGEEIIIDTYTVLYAIWEEGEAVKYTIKYDPNGGEGVMDISQATANSMYTISSCSYTREGYHFIGWNTMSDGTGVSYKTGQKITAVSDLTLFAIWQKDGSSDDPDPVKPIPDPNPDPDKPVSDDEIPDNAPASGIWVKGLKQGFAYTGSPIKPEIRVYDGRKRLYEKKDYTLKYKNNTKPGTAYAVLTMKGNYSGSQDVPFSIRPTSLITDISADAVYTAYKKNKTQKLKPVLYVGGQKLKYGKNDLSFTYPSESVSSDSKPYSDIGTWKIHIAANNTNRFTGEQNVDLVIVNKPVMSAVSVKTAKSGLGYTGSPVTPVFTVKYKGKSLTQGTDYTVIYKDAHTDIGKHTVVLKGNNKDYFGSKTVTFKISGKYDLASAKGGIELDKASLNADGSVPYTYGGAKPVLIVKYDGKTLTAGKDYTVSYKNNKALGTATATVKGKGSYKGSPMKTFEIKQRDINTLSLNIADKLYSSKTDAYKKTPIVFTDGDYKNQKLKKDSDYTVEFSGVSGNAPIAGSEIKVTLQGKGNYKGTINTSYKIIDKDYDFTKTKVTVNGGKAYAYTGKAITPAKGDLQVSIKNKGNLGSEDYDIIGYYNNIKKGNSAYIKLRGKGKYSGVKMVKFKIGAAPMESEWSGVIMNLRDAFAW